MPKYAQRASLGSKLDPYKDYLQLRLEHAKPNWIPAVVLKREIDAMGYTGGITILRDYLKPFKTVTPEPIVRFETAPAHQMQIDFTTIRKGRDRIKAFVATLGFSRATYVRFYESEIEENWIDGVKKAFDYFGGVVTEVLCDNAKAIIITRNAYGEGKHVWNTSMLSLANDYGFTLRVCKPYRAKTKGKVERFNGYLKSSFIVPLVAQYKQNGLNIDIDVLNYKVGAWLYDVAHQRIHATTLEKPQVRLDIERQLLRPIPVQYDATYTSAVGIAMPTPIESIQHPLSVYDKLITTREINI